MINSQFAKNIKALRLGRGLTQRQLAEAVDVDVLTAGNWERQGKMPRQRETIQRLCDLFDVNENDLFGYADGFFSKATGVGFSFGLPLVTSSEPGFLPRGGFAHAGEVSDPNDIENVMVEVPKSVAENHPEGRVYRVEGDCMNKVYPEGCQVVADPAIEPRNGSVVCMATESGDVIMRRMYRLAGQLILSPDSFNPEHENMIFDDPDAAPLTYLGTVVWFQAEKEME